jgi:hypothetical protein
LRHRKAERLGGLEVDDHLELGRKLYWEIARVCAAQDAIDIGGSATKVSTASGPKESKPPGAEAKAGRSDGFSRL